MNTKSLLAAVPLPGGRRVIDQVWLEGEPPDLLDVPSGCRFRNRYPMAQQPCAAEDRALRPPVPGRDAACHFA